MANDWIVVVKSRGASGKRRVFVEDVAYKTQAEQIALSKLGVTFLGYETHAEIVDERVSAEISVHMRKEMYDRVVIELAEAQKAFREVSSLTSGYLARAEIAETERDHLSEVNTLAQTNINLVRSELDDIQKSLERRHDTKR